MENADALYDELRIRNSIALALIASFFLHALLFAWLSGVQIDMPQHALPAPLVARLQANPAPGEAHSEPKQLPPAPKPVVRKEKARASRPTQAQSEPIAALVESSASAEAVSPVPSEAAGVAATAAAEPVKEPLDNALVGRYRIALICALKRHRSYPVYAQKREWSGKVRMRAEFAEDGRLQNVVVIRSSGLAILDESAAETVRKAQADTPVPQRLLGHSFSIEQEIEYQFDTQPAGDVPVSCPSA